MKKYRIAHVGAFDFENYGDLLFVEVFERNIRNYIEIDEIVLFAPKKCKMPFTDGKREVYSVAELESMHRKSAFDAIVVGGGDLVHCSKIRTYMPHISDEWVWYEVLYMWMIPSVISWKYNIPLVWNAPGVPMTFMESEKMMVKELCKYVDYMSVRGNISKSNLEECCVDNIVNVVPDTVFSISEIISKQELKKQFYKLDVLSEEKYIVFHANHTFLDTEIEGCIKTLRKIKENQGVDILLLPIGYALGDENFIKELVKRCPNEFVTIEQKLTPMDMLSLIVCSAGYVGASLHGCITAATYDVPVVVCNYNRFTKVNEFLELIHLEEAVVYRTEDIYPVFEQQLVPAKDIRRHAIQCINKHFAVLSRVIQSGKKKMQDGLEVALCEYIYDMRTMQLCHQENMRQQEMNFERREDLLKQQEMEWQLKYHDAIKAYEEILNSSVWKSTKPMRIMLDFIKKIIKG